MERIFGMRQKLQPLAGGRPDQLRARGAGSIFEGETDATWIHEMA